MKARYTSIVVIAISLLACAGCSSRDSANANANTISAPVRKDLTAADIAKLKWIEGTYRGTGETQPPFFERYSFEGTTMIVESFEDETLAKVTDTSRFELKDGQFGSTDGERRSAASEITDTYVQFVPVTGGGNSFRFERVSENGWRAVLDSPAKGDRPAKQVIYEMEPVDK